MSAPEFTANGVVIQTFEEIYAELSEGYRQIYGQTINLDQDSPDGQRLRIETKARHDLQQFGLAVANGFDPDFAVGQSFQKLAKLINIFPRPATRSQWDLTITSNRNLTLPANYTVRDDLGQSWILVQSVNILAGANTVTFVAELFGDVAGDIGAVINQQTVVLGIVSITAAAEAVKGFPEETPAQFRVRRSQSTANLGFSVLGKLYAALASLPGVTDLQIYENKTSVNDTVRDIAANTLWAVIEGGSVDSIAEVLTKQRTAGCDTKGSVTGVFRETVTRPNGTTFIIEHAMEFDRPVNVPLFIRFNYTRKNVLQPVDEDLIRNNMAALFYGIGQQQQAGDLYVTARSAGDNYIVTDLEISLDEITWTDGNLTPGFAGKFTVDPNDVSITELAP